MRQFVKRWAPAFAIAALVGIPAGVAIADGDRPAERTPQLDNRIDNPIRLTAGDQPISVDIGHAHPLVIDWTGNGVNDLLVGQFGDGKLRLYRNTGTNAEPKFDGFEYVAGPNRAALSIPAG